MSYRNSNKDRIHNDVVAALEAVGCEVEDFHAAKSAGVPDLHVCVRDARGARLYWLELKSPEAVFCKNGKPRKTVKSNPKTLEAQRKWATRFPVYRVTSVREALMVTGFAVMP